MILFYYVYFEGFFEQELGTIKAHASWTYIPTQSAIISTKVSPRFLCRPTALYIFARAVGRQRTMHTENSGFASPTLGRHISTFRGYRILFSIRNPYINRFTNHFSIHS